MPDTILVKSKPGAPCPRHDNPRQYIPDAFPTNVPNNSYYRRRIADGSLVKCDSPEVKAPKGNPAKPSTPKKEKKPKSPSHKELNK